MAVTPGVVAEHGLGETTVDNIVKAAGVARAAFYKQFDDKHACFAIVHAECQERLFGAVTYPCYTKGDLRSRVAGSLLAGLEFLAREPDLAHLVTVEAPAARGDVLRSHLVWMRRYCELLRLAVVGVSGVEKPSPEMEQMIVMGISGRIRESILEGEAEGLAGLAPVLTDYALSFYARSR